jgi:hypothetical protein
MCTCENIVPGARGGVYNPGPRLVARRDDTHFIGREEGERLAMTLFDDRERAFEAKFRLDQEMGFKVTVRRDRLLGLWAAAQMGLAEEEAKAYARSLVDAEMEHRDVFVKVLGDLKGCGLDLPEAALRQRMEALHETARQQVFAELAGK